MNVLKFIIPGVAVPFILFRINDKKTKKALQYDYSRGDIEVTQSSFKTDLQITYQGRLIEQASVVTVTIECTGGAPIQSTDFESSLRMNLPDTKRILSVRASSRPPEVVRGLKLLTTPGEESLPARQIAPLLMNPRDTLTLFVLVESFGNRVQLTGRITGVTRIDERVKGGSVLQVTPTLLLITVLTLLVSGSLGYRSFHDFGQTTRLVLDAVGAVVILVVWAAYINSKTLPAR